MTAKRSWRAFRPPSDVGLTAWAEENVYLPEEISERHGRYRVEVTPWMEDIQEWLTDPNVTDVVLMKSAQVGWTLTVILYLLWRARNAPCGMIVMFPRKQSATEFVLEKFNPVVDSTPTLSGIISTSFSRKDGNKTEFRKFLGGWLKFIGSHSATGTKSSTAPVVFVEEPDDADTDVGGQGASIRLLKERTKTFRDAKRVQGGTPTIKDLSAIEHALKLSDRQRFFVPCQECGEAHVLEWENVQWPEDADIAHEVYGRAKPDEAWYQCPTCGARWSDWQRFQNVARAKAAGFGFRATAPFSGVRGGQVSELYSGFPGSNVTALVRKYLEAKHKERQGDLTDLVAFFNNQLGLPYEYASGMPDAKDLEARAEHYERGTVPEGGLVLVAGVDCQHNRLAVKIVAYGRGEESWLVLYDEIPGSVTDSADDVWKRLDEVVFASYPHASGARLTPWAVSIDSSDGATSDNVYKWVRRNQHRGARAVKGDSWEQQRRAPADREIYVRPRPVDHRSDTKAAKYGLAVFLVGTQKAKDLISQRQKLSGEGPGRMHWYNASAGYFRQMLSEVKAPDRRVGGKLTWQVRKGEPNEAWDCEVYCLHAGRRLGLHRKPAAWWDAREAALRQPDLLSDTPAPAPDEIEKPKRAPRARRGGYVGGWKK